MTLRVPLGSRRATLALGRRLADAMKQGDLVLLEGTLGAGKTFLARAIARALGVPREVTVGSPTFALVHEYDARLRFVHADLYRLERPEDVRELGLRDARAGGAAVLVEWGERFVRELGDDGLLVRISLEGGARTASLEPLGARGGELARAAAGGA